MFPRFLQMVESILTRPDKSEEGLYIKKILSDYRNKRHIYDEFRSAVHKLLDTILKDNNYKYQIVSRTKTIDRLREKLERKSAKGIHYPRLNDVQDLAGVRVLFYSEADKDRFLTDLKREIDGTFQVDNKKHKNGYAATHVIMSFGPKRLSLSEYRHFFDLKCEIQITSILRHTWAEIEHDFIYKDISGLKKRDPAKFAVMEKKLEEILEKHIKQASKEFEKLIKWADE